MKVVAALALLALVPTLARTQVPADLRSAMQTRATATSSADVTTWDRLTADNFMLVSADGRLLTKAQRIAALKLQQPEPQPQLENESVQTYGNVAVQRFQTTGAWVTLIWAKTRGAWRVTNAQVTPLLDDSTSAAAVTVVSEQYRRAWLQGETGKALALVSDDVRLMIQGAPDVRGRAATTALFAQEMAAYKIPSLAINRDQLVVRADYAIDIGTYQETLIPTSGTAAPINAAGRYVTIWRREGPGWRLLASMLNSSTREFQ